MVVAVVSASGETSRAPIDERRRDGFSGGWMSTGTYPPDASVTSHNSCISNPDVAERLVLGERTVCEVGAVAITDGDRTSGAAAPSFRADRRVGAGQLNGDQL